MTQTIKPRFCPSPTGLITLGNTRTALFNALYARGHDGVFLLRIEDTDQTRSKEEYTEQMQADLLWLGLDWQEGPGHDLGNGPYWQSQRHEVYAKYYAILEQEELAYPCFCSEEQLALSRKIQRSQGQPPRYSGTCRSLSKDEIAAKLEQGLKPTLRFKVPSGTTVEFQDHVKGLQKFLADDIGDFIIRRADGTAAFMYCNAVDDAMMGTTHVIRGEDHLTNTPRQIMILQALNLPLPEYCHVSMIVGADGKPLSKRFGNSSIQDLRAAGYLPLAINNYLARLGHYYADNALMSLDELAQGFEFANLGSAPARYDASQLDYWQKEAVLQLSEDELAVWLGDSIDNLVPENSQADFINCIKDNIVFSSDATKWAQIIFAEKLEVADKELEILKQADAEFYQVALDNLPETQTDFKALCKALTSQLGVKGKQLFQPLRIALTGQLHGPQMPEIVKLMGVERIQSRLQQAQAYFN